MPKPLAHVVHHATATETVALCGAKFTTGFAQVGVYGQKCPKCLILANSWITFK